jgi:hypothetical protein
MSQWRRVSAPGSQAPPPTDQLTAVLAPGLALADVDGLTLVLASVELWTSSLFLRMAVLRNAVTDGLDAEHREAFERWSAGDRASPPPPQPGARLNALPLTVTDDAGTAYVAAGRASSGSGTEWRSEWKYEPGPPASATRLTLALQGTDAGRQEHVIALPVQG